MLKLTNDQLIKSASYASVIFAFIIMIVKIYGWIVTDSQSMLASLIDSCLDISSSIINLIAVSITLLPPDDNHRFGHEKFQDLAIFSQSIFFFASCLFTLFSSLKALYLESAPENHGVGANVMYACIVLTFLLVSYQTYVIKRTKAKIIEADKLHYFADLITNIAVLFSLYISNKFWYVDSVVGILISIYIMHASYRLFRDAMHNLSDQEFKTDEREKILRIINRFPEAQGVHELKTRSAGNKPFIQFHLEMDGGLSLIDAHEISDKISDKLLESFPGAEIIVHQDPVGLEKKFNEFSTIQQL